MKKSILTIITVLTLMCSCRDNTKHDEQRPSDRIIALNEFSTEQSRAFLKGFTGDWRGDTDKNKGVPVPPVQKPYPEDAKLIDLVKPEEIKAGSMPLADAVNKRRSRREYTTENLSNDELSFLLWSTQGISAMAKDEKGEVAYYLRTVPSGGARHPFETYLIINHVDDIARGLYRYLPLQHKLLLIRKDIYLPLAITDACYGQNFTGNAAVVFIWSAIPYRTEWSYCYTAHKMIAVEAGHVCQNLYLAAESIGGGACAVLGYDQNKLDKLINVDGKDEFAVYLATVGKVK